MHKISLSGHWQFRQAGSSTWLPASVPGGVHTDLLALALIPDPFVADNEKRVAWVAQAGWQYSRTFTVDTRLMQHEQVWLVCDGLDTLASLSLNGSSLGQTANMFRQYRWDVKALLKPGENELVIHFDSAVDFATKNQALRPLAGVSQAIQGGSYLRKAPCHFGWDWGPQLPPTGIWKDIRLEAFDSARLADIHLRQTHTGGKVLVSAALQIEGDPVDLSASIQVTAPDGTVLTSHQQLTNSPVLALEIANPQLWWPNGLGDQPLYQLRITLLKAGQPLDEKDFQLGLRTIEVRQQPDQWGRSFTFVVNGLPIFAKGANWIPADSFPTRLTSASIEGLLRSAAQTHQNMLRVWGGGFYEDERFYDLCDRYGILVWQDFIFSCSMYPLNDPDFLENVRIEVQENVSRLRHRASLALWCGNNEMEQGWVDWGWTSPATADLRQAYDQFFHHTLAAWCSSADPDHLYWPSSPTSETPFQTPNSQTQGDAHYWDVWHGRKPFTAYRSQFPRFMSEFGFQALPPLETIRSFAQEADWNMTSYIMEQHQKNASGNSLMVGQMLDTFRLPKDFDSMVYLSMLLQAEGIRYGVEHWRRHSDRVAGTLYWQLNDCWPVASWSSLDYFGRWKALHYAARRFYAPLMLSIEDAPPRQSVYLSSDLREPWSGELRWSLTNLAGQILASGQKPAEVAPSSVTYLEDLDFSTYLNDDSIRELLFVAELWQGEERLSLQTAFFVPTKHLQLIDPGIEYYLSSENERLVIELQASSLARLVECSLAGADVIFSDNYFDLPAGRIIKISTELPAHWTLEKAAQALRIRSIYNTYTQ